MIDRFLPHIVELMTPVNGVCYMILVKENKPVQIARILQDMYNLKLEIVLDRKARNEYLMVVKISSILIQDNFKL